jgi:hypothetical protein
MWTPDAVDDLHGPCPDTTREEAGVSRMANLMISRCGDLVIDLAISRSRDLPIYLVI